MAKLFLGQNDLVKTPSADKTSKTNVSPLTVPVAKEDKQKLVGRTSNIKERIASLEGRVLILDFSDEYKDITDNVFLLDEINLLESQLNYREMQAINAGYLHDSHCLYRRSLDLITEVDEYRELKESYAHNTECEEYLEKLYQIRTGSLIENTLERLHISWNKVESDYAKILNDKIPKKRSKNHIPLEAAIHKVLKHRVIRIQAKTMQSEHQRAVAFCLLTRLSYLLDEPFHVIADDISSFFNNGNTKLFLSAIKKETIQFIFGFNKPSVLPQAILPLLTTIYFHKIDNNSEIKELIKVFKLNEGHEIIQQIRKLKPDQSLVYVHSFNQNLIKET
ncbi:hypothetical protein CN918_25175 [Priestia megaterium]|nr:hypothetical protein CN918_25175 [Priestia megaterium]